MGCERNFLAQPTVVERNFSLATGVGLKNINRGNHPDIELHKQAINHNLLR